MAYIGNPPAERFTSFDYQDLTGGTGTSFTLTHPVGNAQEILVMVNNVVQEPGVAYTVSGTALTMTGSIVAADDFYVVYRGKAIQTATHPSDRALTATDGTFTGDLTVDTNTLHVDAANNRVGVGTASPSVPLSISSADNIVASFGSTDAVQWIAMQDSDTSSSTHVMLGAIGDDLRFRAGNNEVGRWLSGGGLAFNGDTAQANALDDYEEGTWTVNIKKGGSALAVGSRNANYVRVGKLLWISFYWLNTSISTSGSSDYTVEGFPYNIDFGQCSGYQFVPAGYFNIGSTNIFNSEPHRWQANATDKLTMYGASSTDNVSSALLQLHGAGVLQIA